MDERKRSGLEISLRLLKMVKPLTGFMIIAVLAGSLGHLCAILIPSLSAKTLSIIYSGKHIDLKIIGSVFIIAGILRGLLRYGEQLLNHFIAFKILQIIRDKVFKAMRRLSPAKLEGEDKGKLISMITSDIELLEVFYAHTISPVLIAIVVSSVVIATLYRYSPYYALTALVTYFILALVVPYITSKVGRKYGRYQRKDLSKLNTTILDSFRGIKECIQFDYGKERLAEIKRNSRRLQHSNKNLAKVQSLNMEMSTTVLLISYVVVIGVATSLYNSGAVDNTGFIFPVVLFMSSFGPVLALSDLINNLLLTFACGERVLNILDEEPAVEEVVNGKDVVFESMEMDNVDFSYNDEKILENYNLLVEKGEILGISGKSGLGKSTVLKLLMRFYDPQKGTVKMSTEDLKNINTENLRKNESYVAQETYLFNDTVKNNLKIAKLDATDEEIISACKDASIHDFIMTLPKGYDTEVGTLGSMLSEGEKQRMGVARAFLHGGDIILFDEPTSNIDSLNEGIILKSIVDKSGDKTVIIVSHRKSTLNISHKIMEMKSSRSS